jgi:DinB superfamily
MTNEQLKFPIGKYEKPLSFKEAPLQNWLADLVAFPEQLKAEVQPLSTEELLWQYRPQGWSIQQVVHHCADSHINCLLRFKWTLTEDNCIIKPYREELWAELSDTLHTNIESSLFILQGVHVRLVDLINSLSTEQLHQYFVHPQYGIEYRLWESVGNYAWHSRHHLAHVRQAKALKLLA